MTEIDPALSHLAESLAAVVEASDALRLREYLSGRKLPAMGGDLDPADVILRAVYLIPGSPDFTKRLAGLLAPLISDETEAIEALEERRSPKRRSLLMNACHLAAELPAEKNLFESLKGLYAKLQPAGQELGDAADDLRLSLLQALVFQQTDASLEREWFSSLAAPDHGEWSPARRTLLLTAWRGFLWIPPELEKVRSGEVVDFDRIERGILALHSTVRHHENAVLFLETCLSILAETYPRSAEFWAKHFENRVVNWPRELQDILYRKWRIPPKSVTDQTPQEALLSLRFMLEQPSVVIEEDKRRLAIEIIDYLISGRRTNDQNSEAIRRKFKELDRLIGEQFGERGQINPPQAKAR